MIQVAVLGYGTVGSGVVEVIETNKAAINKRAGAELNIKYILDLRDFPGDPYEDKVVHDYNIILNDPEVAVVCETMGGINPAYEFSKNALLAGKSVCTSNKELVATHGPELISLAREHHCNYLFEASVGGGILINAIEQSVNNPAGLAVRLCDRRGGGIGADRSEEHSLNSSHCRISRMPSSA